MATSLVTRFPAVPSPPTWKLPERRPTRKGEYRLVDSEGGASLRERKLWIRTKQLPGSRRPPPRRLIECSARAKDGEPLLLRVLVAGATELLRAFTGSKGESSASRTDQLSHESAEAAGLRIVSSTDLVEAIRSDFAKSYFLTGDFSDSLYSEDCFYKDPTVRFSGRELYKRNLKLLVPFYEDPSLVLDSIREGAVEDESSAVILANWRLRVYLKLPWKPFVAVDGLTTYSWDKHINRIVSHVESWNITGLQAMGQLTTPSDRAFWRNRKKVAKQE